ncbi:hypothetical protein BM221_003335 [Beauveria bassiana]|uniref:Glycosyltransferase 2 n=1 Tax=Beauveria bassiana TaxID=176275 RepID=A0A2N6NUC8_BEABA|nr:hypothetical protein BM221_003335 [Beauveria bassiana]
MASSSLSRWLSRNVWIHEKDLAKKDDDVKLPYHNGHGWQAARTPRRRAVLRYAFYVLFVIFSVTIFRRLIYSPEEDIVRPYSQYRHNGPAKESPPTQLTAPKATPGTLPIGTKHTDHSLEAHAGDQISSNARYYKGVIKFHALAQDLLKLSSAPPGPGIDSVLFAASSLQSAANVLPMACERAASQKDRILFALFGDSDIDLQQLLKVNGIDEACKILAIDFLATFVKPLAVIVDGSSTEDRPFLDGIKDQMVDAPRTTLIELPARAQSRLSWISKLDATALAEWNEAHFDILIHAPPTGTGNLKRLLRSLAAADLAGHSIPHITVELPQTLDISLERFLSKFNWPQSSLAGSKTNVKYALLHRRYGLAASNDDSLKLMFGISFTVPKTHIHNTQPLNLPATANKESSFLWQAPSSDAMLIFGDHWVELHGYVSHSLQTQKAGIAVPTMAQSKDVAENQPAWLEYMLQLCRLRNYFTLYPSKETADALVGVYADLPDVPDGREKSNADVRVGAQRGSSFDAGSQVDILNTLPKGGALPSIHKLPVVSWEGEVSTLDHMVAESYKQTLEFRRQIGTCKDVEAHVARDRFAADLFCAVKEQKSAR